MPNRIIKESISESEKIASLTDFEFRLWVGLITQADDLGRGDARPAIIKGHVFPLRDRITVKDIDAAIHGLAAKGCVSLYSVGGKPYFWFPTWGEHQRVRDVKTKFPGPEEDDSLREPAASCGNSPRTRAIRGEPRPESESESESESNPKNDSAEQFSAPPVISLPLNDGTDFTVSAEQCQEWAGLYPAVDVIQQLRAMRGWLDANPSRRKTARGIRNFVVRWLSKEQDRGGGRKKPETCGEDVDPMALRAIQRMMEEG